MTGTDNEFSREEALIGEKALELLSSSFVAVFGLGGVGSFAAEALARAGIGKITLVDGDSVDITNINRQLTALHSTLGRKKAEVMRERIIDINPAAEVDVKTFYFTEENAASFELEKYDYLVDACDDIRAKALLAQEAEKNGVPLISCLGTGNKVNPEAFEFADIYDTSVCPLARALRRELKKRGVKKLKTLYSKEPPRRAGCSEQPSLSFVPSCAGLLIAGELIRELIKKSEFSGNNQFGGQRF